MGGSVICLLLFVALSIVFLLNESMCLFGDVFSFCCFWGWPFAVCNSRKAFVANEPIDIFDHISKSFCCLGSRQIN